MRRGRSRGRVFGPRLRQGVKPPRILPTSLAIGWERCRTRTTVRSSRSDHRLVAREPRKRARAAEIAAWATGTARERSRHGPRRKDASHPRLSRNIPERIATSRYHSGIRAQDQRERIGWYSDWNGAVPQTPW